MELLNRKYRNKLNAENIFNDEESEIFKRIKDAYISQKNEEELK